MADLVSNPQTGESWYTVRIHIPQEQLHRLGKITLLAGIPLEAFIQTGDLRIVLSCETTR